MTPLTRLASLALLLASGRTHGAPASPILEYPGPCDASAAVAISATLFVVANDEDNILRVYRRDRPAQPVYSLDVSRFLDCLQLPEAGPHDA